MKGVVLGILILTLSTSTSPALAAVFERDWKAPGDGLLTYDDVNQREWLDLSQTLLEGFPGETLNAKYESLLSELEPGGLFETFVAAQTADVVALAKSSGIDYHTTDFATNADASLNLIGHLGVTRTNIATGRVSSRGMLDEFEIPFGARPEAIFDYFPPQPAYVGNAGLIVGTDDLVSPSTTGAMLFRRAVPEPSAITLAAFFIAGAAITGAIQRRCAQADARVD